MNAAFLILSSVCMTGADPAPVLAPSPLDAVAADKAPAEKIPANPAGCGTAQAAPVIAPVPAAGSCGGSCGSCGNDCNQWHEGHGLFSRWRTGGSHHGCDTCNTCAPAPCATCDTCAKPTSIFDRFRSHGSCDSCGSPGLFGRFHSHSSGCGCDTGCSGCNTVSGTIGGTIEAVPAKPGEPLKAMPKEAEPKKLPTGGKEISAPIAPELTPTTSRTIEVGTKSPF